MAITSPSASAVALNFKKHCYSGPGTHGSLFAYIAENRLDGQQESLIPTL